MADGELTIQIDAALAERLRTAAEAAGESVDAYVRHALETFSDDPADWDEVDRICDAVAANGDGVPLQAVSSWLRSWGEADKPTSET